MPKCLYCGSLREGEELVGWFCSDKCQKIGTDMLGKMRKLSDKLIERDNRRTRFWKRNYRRGKKAEWRSE